MITLASGRLTIIGTSHISAQSVEEVKNLITINRPGIVAVELDSQRLYSLEHPQKKGRTNIGMARQLGISGYLFLVFASWAQKQLGRVVKLSPGSDMLVAIKTAKELKIPIALIDQEISITIQRISKYLTWRERFRFLRDLFMGVFFPKREMKRLGLEGLDLRKVPTETMIEKMVESFKSSYPTLYRVLVTERNKVMAKRLAHLLRNSEHQILAVVGAGHEKAIAELVEAYLSTAKTVPNV